MNSRLFSGGAESGCGKLSLINALASPQSTDASARQKKERQRKGRKKGRGGGKKGLWKDTGKGRKKEEETKRGRKEEEVRAGWEEKNERGMLWGFMTDSREVKGGNGRR